MKSTNARFGDIASQENINKQVIASELKNLRDGTIIREVQVEYIDKAKTKGLVSPADAKIFEIVMEESPLFTEQLLKNIKERNTLFITKISTMLPQAKSLNQSAVQRWEQIIQTIKDANTYIDSMTLKIQSSNEKKQD